MINGLTDDDVIKDVTLAVANESTGVSSLLSNLTYDESNNVVGSSAMMSVWLLIDNGTKVEGQANNDPVAKDWEEAFLKVIVGEDVPEGLPDGAMLEGVAERRYRVNMTMCL